MNVFLSSRSVALTILLVIGGYGLYAGGQRWFRSGEAVVREEEKTAETPLPEATEPAQPIPDPEAITLNLKVHDRFPLQKTVKQYVKIPSTQGGWSTNTSSLELLLSVTVEEVRPAKPDDDHAGVVRLAVKYHRVRVAQDLPGSELDFDSDTPPARVPLAAQAYYGLKDNGFQFWLNRKNQIVEVVGFDKFLDRCLQRVTPSQRDKVRATLEGTTGLEGVANFVDHSVGALPAEAVRVGATWKADKKYMQPVPMWLRNQYTLRSLTPEKAEIDIVGSIEKVAQAYTLVTASNKQGQSDSKAAEEIKLEVTGGHTSGSCLIDRKTGLPVKSTVEQSIQMVVHMPGGIDFPQEKTTVTTIGYFTQGNESAITIGQQRRREDTVRPASATQTNRPRAASRSVKDKQ